MLDNLYLLQILPDQYCRRNDVRQEDRNKKGERKGNKQETNTAKKAHKVKTKAQHEGTHVSPILAYTYHAMRLS